MESKLVVHASKIKRKRVWLIYATWRFIQDRALNYCKREEQLRFVAMMLGAGRDEPSSILMRVVVYLLYIETSAKPGIKLRTHKVRVIVLFI